MGPSEEALKLADHLKEKHPEITTDRIELAYTIDRWVDNVDG